MSSNWTEWSKFVLISIDKIQNSLKSLEENIITIKTEITLLKDYKNGRERADGKNEVEMEKIEEKVDLLQKELSKLDKIIAVEKTRFGVYFAGIGLAMSAIGTLVTHFIIKKFF